MRRNLAVALVVVVAAGMGLAVGPRIRPAQAQRVGAVVVETQWEYKVGVFAYNPGERMTDAERARIYERVLNEQAREGWEAMGTVLSRDTAQTVGGAVTTRDTTSFVAYRRARR
jgi:hypothetical protein